ncbi:MAG: sialidase family protein [Candidatus Nanopelagicales bacterium]
MTHVLAIGTRKGLWIARSDDRRSWTLDGPHLLMQEVASVGWDTRRSPARLLVGTMSWHYGPTLVWTDDLGATWQETGNAAIAFPDDTGEALGRIWQLQPDTEARPDVVWAGCEPTSLWRSDDGGESFRLVRGLWDHPHRQNWMPGFGGAAVHTIVPPREGERMLVAMSTGGVYVSDDGDTGWTPSNTGISANFMPDPYPEYGQCVHKVAVDAATPDRMYVQNHNGVYRSDDAGATWTSIADGLPSDFGFFVLSSPTTPGTAWVMPIENGDSRIPVGGRMRLHRTRDAGETWTELGAGSLPDECYTVALRDAACVDSGDPTGVYVGTRDGVVYASADEGDSWQVVAEHLPDVLSVRAAVLP